MSSRKYSAADYGTCRYIVENRDNWNQVTINNAGGSLTVARVERLRLLNLVDGAVEETRDGESIRIAGLGEKTGEEAIRLGIASV